MSFFKRVFTLVISIFLSLSLLAQFAELTELGEQRVSKSQFRVEGEAYEIKYIDTKFEVKNSTGIVGVCNFSNKKDKIRYRDVVKLNNEFIFIFSTEKWSKLRVDYEFYAIKFDQLGEMVSDQAQMLFKSQIFKSDWRVEYGELYDEYSAPEKMTISVFPNIKKSTIDIIYPKLEEETGKYSYQYISIDNHLELKVNATIYSDISRSVQKNTIFRITKPCYSKSGVVYFSQYFNLKAKEKERLGTEHSSFVELSILKGDRFEKVLVGLEDNIILACEIKVFGNQVFFGGKVKKSGKKNKSQSYLLGYYNLESKESEFSTLELTQMDFTAFMSSEDREEVIKTYLKKDKELPVGYAFRGFFVNDSGLYLSFQRLVRTGELVNYETISVAKFNDIFDVEPKMSFLPFKTEKECYNCVYSYLEKQPVDIIQFLGVGALYTIYYQSDSNAKKQFSKNTVAKASSSSGGNSLYLAKMEPGEEYETMVIGKTSAFKSFNEVFMNYDSISQVFCVAEDDRYNDNEDKSNCSYDAKFFKFLFFD